MSVSLQDKRILITAAGQGIGKASAIAFARAGAKVVATDINVDALKGLAGEANIETHVLDVLSEEAVNRVVSSTGPFDVLFNCAGFVHAGTILDMPDKDLDFAFDLNVRAMVRTIRAVLPAMLEKKDGAIINMASVASSMKGVPNRAAYTITKAAVVGLTLGQLLVGHAGAVEGLPDLLEFGAIANLPARRDDPVGVTGGDNDAGGALAIGQCQESGVPSSS